MIRNMIARWQFYRGLLVCTFLCPLFAAQYAAATLITNGSFETYAIPSSSWDVPGIVDIGLPVSDTNIAGWTIINDNIDYVGGGWPASDGERSLDLNGNPGSGGVKQSFATEPGTTYKVTFDMSGNPDVNIPLKTMRVLAAGQFADFSFDTNLIISSGYTDWHWTPHEFLFTANSTSTTLEIFSTTASSLNGPALDNVAVEAVPEPSGLILVVGAAIALATGMYRQRLR